MHHRLHNTFVRWFGGHRGSTGKITSELKMIYLSNLDTEVNLRVRHLLSNNTCERAAITWGMTSESGGGRPSLSKEGVTLHLPCVRLYQSVSCTEAADSLSRDAPLSLKTVHDGGMKFDSLAQGKTKAPHKLGCYDSAAAIVVVETCRLRNCQIYHFSQLAVSYFSTRLMKCQFMYNKACL